MDEFRPVTLIDKNGVAVVATTAADLINYQYADGMTVVPDIPEDEGSPDAPEAPAEPEAPEPEAPAEAPDVPDLPTGQVNPEGSDSR